MNFLFIDLTNEIFLQLYYIFTSKISYACLRTMLLDFYIYILSYVFSFMRVIFNIYLKGEEDEKQTTDSLP